jgi:hypothetical protein
VTTVLRTHWRDPDGRRFSLIDPEKTAEQPDVFGIPTGSG